MLHCLGIDAQLHTNCHFLAIVGFSSLHGFSIVLINDIFIQEFFCQNNSWLETQVNHLASGIRKSSNNRIGDSESLHNIYAFWSFLNASSVQGKCCCVGFSDVRALYKQMSISIPSISFILKHASVIIIRLYLYWLTSGERKWSYNVLLVFW